MDFTGSGDVSWIWATKSGSLKSDDQSASISQHDSEGTFSFSLASAKGGSDVNPFTSSSQTTAGSGSSVSCTPKSSATAAADATGSSAAATSGGSATTTATYPWGTGAPPGAPSDFPFTKRADMLTPRADDNSCDDSGGSSISNEGAAGAFYARMNKMLIAHAVCACLAFAAFFPMGSIAIRLMSFPGLIWVHAAFQIFAYITYIVAFGLGLYIATQDDYVSRKASLYSLLVLTFA